MSSLDSPKLIRPTVLTERVAAIRRTWYNKHDRHPRLVQCSGCFDLLHPGHVRHLQTARSWGDLLIVSINDDDSVRRLKGPSRPILDVQERAIMLAAQAAVDYVTWFSEDTPDHVIECIKPDLYVKGDEYAPEQIPELTTVFRYGAFRPLPHSGWTTTTLIERVVEAHQTHVVRRLSGSAQIRTETVTNRTSPIFMGIPDREGSVES